ncbi:hypothetical protein PGT21_018842 [Puccinia graminis f. sp. tritici]|uniref:Uncharacterized protein n=1 Tax=Puccinia graminis f. sp. tritici TaxID=56615 RepID=A0A5B0SF96_PUCGR|nr:hypothetical protein PGT21_018842 [Puccinia graminis f. sp. tritici]KAA1136179.1 hypothetical protein PGTUg99_034417 [Puccinia graminis f. sp. tritici]
MPGLPTISQFAFVVALLLKSFLIAPGLRGPPPDPALYTDRCQRCWQVAGSPTEFINTMVKTFTYNDYPCSAFSFSHESNCPEMITLQQYYCTRCCHYVEVSLGGCSTHAQLIRYAPARPRQ